MLCTCSIGHPPGHPHPQSQGCGPLDHNTKFKRVQQVKILWIQDTHHIRFVLCCVVSCLIHIINKT